MSQVDGLVMIQQQLERVSVHNTLHSLQELLMEAVEERRNTDSSSAESPSQRSLSNSVDSWRLSATAKFVGTRYNNNYICLSLTYPCLYCCLFVVS